MFNLFNFLDIDIKKCKQLQKELEKKADSTDVYLINQLQIQREDCKEKLNSIYEVYLIVVIIGFFLALLVNEIYNLNLLININSFFLTPLIFINLIAFFFLLDETLRLMYRYSYNKIIMFSSITLILIVNGLYVTLRENKSLTFYNFFNIDYFIAFIGYLIISLIFVFFMIKIIKFYDLILEVLGYKAPKSKVDSLSSI